MKKVFKILFCIIVILAITSTVLFVKPATVKYQKSDIYTREEINEAINVVKEKFNDFEGCKLFALSYAGDEISSRETSYNEEYDQIMVIKSVFLSPIVSKGSWNPHEIYTWNFILVRNNNEEWRILNWGYA